MGNKKIERTDLVAKDAITSVIKEADELILVLKKIVEVQEEIIKKNAFKTGKDLKQYSTAIKSVKTSSEALSKVEKDRKRLQEQLKVLNSDAIQQNEELKVQMSLQRKANSDLAKEKLGLISVYSKESKRLRDLKNQYKESILTQGKSAKATKNLEREVRKLDRQLKEVDDSAGDFYRNIGNYPNAIGKSVKAIAALTAGILAANGAAAGIKDGLQANEEGSEDLRKSMSFLDGAARQAKNSLGQAASGAIDLIKAMTGNGGIFAVGAAMKKVTTSFDDFGKKVKESGEANYEAEEALIQIEKSNRDYSRSLAEVNRELEIQEQLAGDATRSFDQIEAATVKVTELNIKRANIQKKIALEDLDRVNALIDTRKALGQNVADLLDDQLAAELAFSDAETELVIKQLDNTKVRRENARDRFEQELDYAIDAFDAQKSLNERQINDETNTFDERRALLTRTTFLTAKAFTNQQKLVEDFTGEKLNLNELVKEDDEEVIRATLANFQLDEITKTRILEIIKEQKIARQDLADLERDLLAGKKEEAIETVNFINDIEQAQFEGQIIGLEGTAGKEKELYELKKAQLIAQADFETSLEGKTAEEIEAIRANLANSLARLDIEEKNRIKAKTEAQVEYGIELTKTFINALSAKDEALNRSLDNEIERTNNNLTRQQSLAEQGLENQLAFEQAKAAKLEIKRQEAQKREEKRQKTLAYFTAFTELLKENPNTAAAKAAVQIAIAETVSGLFYEGTENVGESLGKPVFSGRDGYVVRVDGSERIMTGEQNRRIGGMSNESLAKLAEESQSMSHSKSGSFAAPAVLGYLARIEKAVESSKYSVDWDGLEVRTEKLIENGQRKTVRTLRNKKRLK